VSLFALELVCRVDVCLRFLRTEYKFLRDCWARVRMSDEPSKVEKDRPEQDSCPPIRFADSFQADSPGAK